MDNQRRPDNDDDGGVYDGVVDDEGDLDGDDDDDDDDAVHHNSHCQRHSDYHRQHEGDVYDGDHHHHGRHTRLNYHRHQRRSLIEFQGAPESSSSCYCVDVDDADYHEHDDVYGVGDVVGDVDYGSDGRVFERRSLQW